MATGALVPHTLPNGQTVMVPEYLVPKGPGALAMPAAAKPSGPDLRVASMGGAAGWGSLDEPPDPELFKQDSVADIRKKLAPAAPTTAPKEHKGPGDRFDQLSSIGGKEKPTAKVDPSTLHRGAPQQQAEPEGEDGEMDPMVRKVFNESLRGGRGGGGRPTGEVVASRQIVREPGKELLPEYKWAHGLEARPDFGQEIDPDAEQPTWGNADPIMRDRKTGIERGAEASGMAARSEFERQETERQELAVAQREQLLAQSKLIDEQLNTVAERRNRIASLQEVADKRMREAESMEPRTKSEVWESKSGFAQAMAFLSVAIGGYTAGLGRNGGKNPGWDMLNNFLDAEVEGERYKAESRKKLGMEAKNDVERAMAQYGDLEMASLESKNRKLANVMAMTQQMLSQKGMDATAKMRGEQVYASAQEQFLANQQQLFDQIAGKVTKEEINFKPGAPTGGGGAPSTLEALEKAARAKKAVSTIAGEPAGYARSVEGDKLADVNGAMEAIDAAEAVERDVRGLGADSSDFDDPLSGPLDAAAKVLGTGGSGRRTRQSLEANTKRLARGIQQSLGKSDNDARLADEMAIGDGSGVSRLRAAETAKKQALGRIQTAAAGMTPQQREAFLQGLTPERRAQVQEALRATAQVKRSATEAPLE